MVQIAMSFLKRIFGGGGAGGDRAGLYFYVQPKDCDEVLRVRIDRNNDLSRSDDGAGHHVRKMLTASDYRCRKGLELQVFFDDGRKFKEAQVENGDLVTEAEWVAWQAAKSGGSNTTG